MISRKTTVTLSDAIVKIFSRAYDHPIGSGPVRRHVSLYEVKVDELYDYLFENNYEAWFCNLAKTTKHRSEEYNSATRELKELIMKLHTGEAIAHLTPKWTWEQRQQLGQKHLENLAEDLLNTWHSTWSELTKYYRPISEEKITLLIRNLELDGYIYSNKKLLSPEKDVLNVEQETSLLKNLYTSLGLSNSDVAFHHLTLSEEHYVSEKWDDSISNSRKYFECVLQEVAAQHSQIFKNAALPEEVIERPIQVRAYLEKENLLEKKEIEAVAKIYGLLSHTGNHPYMAKKDQARLLRNLSLTFSQFVLLRLQGILEDGK